MNIVTVSFFGHRYIDDHVRTRDKLYNCIYTLLKEYPYIEFMVGRNGEFDILAASVIRQLNKEYRSDNNYLTLVLPYPTKEYLDNTDSFNEYYDDVVISLAASRVHPKIAIIKRNEEMIDRSEIIICYVLEKKGGAYNAMKYAKKKNKVIINLADD